MPPLEDLQATLERVLASEPFAQSNRLSRFLRFVVEMSLAGQASELKEYRVGTEVFDKGSDFDPRLDPTVRVEARRLRAKLSEYYEGPGAGDSIRIQLPKGGYSPAFEPNGSHVPAPSDSRRWIWAGAFLLVAVAIAAAFALRPTPKMPVLVYPWVDFADRADQGSADMLAELVAVEVTRTGRFGIVAWPRFVEYRAAQGGPFALTTERAARDLGAQAVLTVGIHSRGGKKIAIGVLMRLGQGMKQWAGEYELRDDTVPTSIAQKIASNLVEQVR